MTKILSHTKYLAITSTLVFGVAFSASAGPSARDSIASPGGNFYTENNGSSQFADDRRQAYYFERGVKQYRKQDFQLASISFEKVLNSRHHSKYYYQSNAFLGLISAEKNDHKNAVRYLRHAVKGNPNLYGLKTSLGLSYVELGEMTKAKAILADLKEKKDRSIYQGANEIDLRSSIAVLENALIET